MNDDGRRAAERPTATGIEPDRRTVRNPHSGRRPGPSATRERILDEARRLFAERGFESTTIRAVAGAAAVDPALVHHYYGTKDGLLEAALTLPVDTRTRIPRIVDGDTGGLGERATRAFLELWEDDAIRPVYLAIVRCAASNDRAAEKMRGVVGRQVVGPIVEALGVPDAQLRANLAATQFIGLAMARYLTRLEPLASCDLETVVGAVGPTIQRYLAGDLGGAADRLGPGRDADGTDRTPGG